MHHCTLSYVKYTGNFGKLPEVMLFSSPPQICQNELCINVHSPMLNP
jgi:hypothetical protein